MCHKEPLMIQIVLNGEAKTLPAAMTCAGLIAHLSLTGKRVAIERCVARAKEEFLAAGEHFATDFTRQDAAVLNVQRACEAALDISLAEFARRCAVAG